MNQSPALLMQVNQWTNSVSASGRNATLRACETAIYPNS